jgi:hypothetical protein
MFETRFVCLDFLFFTQDVEDEKAALRAQLAEMKAEMETSKKAAASAALKAQQAEQALVVANQVYLQI